MSTVSIMIPAYNAAHSLPMVIASLRAQTHDDWEAVIVDDGSTDHTWDVLNGFSEPRLVLHRFTENRGRGVARQKCLELAEGEFLAMIDADDWIYPKKLEHQIALLRAEPSVDAVSNASAITDGVDCVGLSRHGLPPDEDFIVGTFDNLGPPPLPFPPAMLRMSAAKRATFNPEFRRSQDSDYMIKVLLGRRYAVSGEVVYAYSQADAASLKKTLEGYSFRMRCYLQYRHVYPLTVARHVALTAAKMATYRAFGTVGLEERLIERRWGPADDATHTGYRAAKRAVETFLSPSVPAE